MGAATGEAAPEVVVGIDRDSIGFSAAHFSVLDTGAERLHGHNYRVALRARGRLRDDGMLVDFGVLKGALREECGELDHRMLVPTACPEVTVVEHADGQVELREGARHFLLPASDCRLLPVRNTTCECLAGLLLERLRRRLGGSPVRLEVTVEESPGQGATVSEG
jgi:6-pyruvoyltetrahydropterin/6-carboxytetrahydropterin synthase